MKIKAGLETEYANWKDNNNQDAYSKGVVDYAEAWAALMEKAEEAGENIAQCAKRTSNEADTDGITGFMYGCAVSALARFWENGEALRMWHNLDTQIGTEGEEANENGGTLNPALLNITAK